MRAKLDSLTSLRFFAAALIVIHHTSWLFAPSRFISARVETDYGVTFFYVLSGFILTYAYQNISTRRDILDFAIARIARIWPVHLIMLAITLAIFSDPWGYAGMTSLPLKIFANAFLFQAWIPYAKYFFSFNGVSWSISVEAFFYILFPFLVIRWSGHGIWKLVAALLCAFGIVAIAEKLHLPWRPYGDPDMGPATWVSTILPVVRLPEFVLGICCGKWWLSASKEGKGSIWTMLELCVLTLAGFALVYGTVAVWSLHLPPLITTWLSRLAPAPIFALLVFVFASGRGIVSKCLSWRPLVFLGEVSFSLYMVHEILMRAIVQYAPSLFFRESVWLGFLVFWVLSLMASAFVWAAVEKPGRRLIISVTHPHNRRKQASQGANSPTQLMTEKAFK